MKTYTFQELKNLSAQQGYKLAALESPTGQKVQAYNQLKIKVGAQLDKLQTRLSAEVFPDGVYTILLAHSLGKTSSPDRYAVLKGKVAPEVLAEAEKRSIPLTPTIIERSPDVLSYDKALQYQSEISELKNTVALRDMEIQKLKEELAELEEENAGLSETQTESTTKSFLTELVPQAMPILDRWFSLEEKKLDLEALKLNRPAPKKSPTQTRQIVAGTQEHLDVIENYYNAENEEALNRELDKLQDANPDLYNQVLERLNLSEGEEEGAEQ